MRVVLSSLSRRLLLTFFVVGCADSANKASPDSDNMQGSRGGTQSSAHFTATGATSATNASPSGGSEAAGPPNTSGGVVSGGDNAGGASNGATSSARQSSTSRPSNTTSSSAGGSTGKPRTVTGGAIGSVTTGGTNSATSTRTGSGGTGDSKSSSSKATGGVALGGAAAGGVSSTPSIGGANGALPKFILGADISSVDEAIDSGSKYADTDGTTKSIFEILKNHGFNFIRLRTFVNPGAKYGYAYGTGGSCVKSEAYCDTEHTVAFAKQVKAAGMGLLLDLHYSDNWADPGNQIIPEDWRDAANITELASRVKTYSTEVVSKLKAAGALPEIVQIGNEITPGMLVHVPNSNTDCWGNNVSTASVNGSTSNWSNLGTLLKAGIEGVKAVDPTIKTMIHIENTKSASGVVSWVQNARKQGVAMDIVGLSCYVAFQGEPSVWKSTFNTLVSTFSDLSFVIAEYNPQRTQANQIMRDLPNGRGLGTFFWEPTQSGEWGSSMFTWSGNTGRANTADFQEFDTIAASVGLK